MTYRDYMNEAARAYWHRILDTTGGSVTKAAAVARVNRTAAQRLLRRLGVIKPKPQNRGKWQEFGL